MVFTRDARRREAGEFVLTDWVRDLAQLMNMLDDPSLVQIKAAVEAHLPGKFRLLPRYLPNPDSAQDWLNHILDIACVIRVGGDHIAWSATTNEAEAEALLRAFTSEPYTQARRALGIRYHWILLVSPQFGIKRRDIVEAYSDFIEAGANECAIVRP